MCDFKISGFTKAVSHHIPAVSQNFIRVLALFAVFCALGVVKLNADGIG